MSTRHMMLTAHHSHAIGQPPYTMQQKRWSRCAVAAKSRHFFARSTMKQRKNELRQWRRGSGRRGAGVTKGGGSSAALARRSR